MGLHRDSAFFYMHGAEGQLPLPGVGPDEPAPSDLADPLRRSRAKEMALEVLHDRALERIPTGTSTSARNRTLIGGTRR